MLSGFTTGIRCRGSFNGKRITLSRPRCVSRTGGGGVVVRVVVVVVVVVFEVLDDVPGAGVVSVREATESPGAGLTVSAAGGADDVSARPLPEVHAARTPSVSTARRAFTSGSTDAGGPSPD